MVLILGIGLAVRLGAIHQARFDGDEAHIWDVALSIAEGRSLPVLGPAISGSPAALPGAFTYYLMAIPQLLTRDPMAGSVFIVLLNLLALWLAFRALRDAWSPAAATVFLLLAVGSPWTVVYSDRIWASNLGGVLGGVVFAALVAVIRKARSRAIAPLAFVLVAGMQIHLSTMLLWVMVLGTLAVKRPRLNVRALVLGAALGAIAYLPYLIYEVSHGFANTKAMLRYAPGGALSLVALAGLFLHFFGFATTDVSYLFSHGYWFKFDHFEFWAKEGVEKTGAFYSEIGGAGLLWAFQVLGWLLVGAGLIYGLWRWLASRDRWSRLRHEPITLPWVAGVAGIAFLYFLSKKAGFAHYVNMVILLAFFPTVALLSRALRHPIARYAATAYLLAAPIVGALVIGGYYRLDSLRSLPQQKNVISFILRETEAKRPFALRFSFPQNQYSYDLLARHFFRTPWLKRYSARDIFTVVPKEHLSRILKRRKPAGVLRLDTIAVLHEKRQ